MNETRNQCEAHLSCGVMGWMFTTPTKGRVDWVNMY